MGQLPWGHIRVLLDKVESTTEREWYANEAVKHGWSRRVLLNQVMNRLRERTGAALSNFSESLPPADSELAQQLTRDPYVLDFLDIVGPAAERDLEDAIMSRLQEFLLELGHGLAFVSRQYPVTLGDDEFTIELLFFNWVQSRFVVIELKVDRFALGHLGQLGFYVAWADENLRRPQIHAPTIGILLCAGRNESVVRFSLAGSKKPLRPPAFGSGDGRR